MSISSNIIPQNTIVSPEENEWDKLDFKGKLKAVSVLTGVVSGMVIPILGSITWSFFTDTCYKLGSDATLWDRFSGKSLTGVFINTLGLSFAGRLVVKGYQTFVNEKNLSDKIAGVGLSIFGVGFGAICISNIYTRLKVAPIIYPNDNRNEHYFCYTMPYFIHDYSPEQYSKYLAGES